MNKNLSIYVDRLKDGHTQKIEEEISSNFLDVKEEELSFPSPVSIQGKAYLADDELVLQFDIHTQFIMPCAICNEKISLPIEIKNFYHVEPIAEIKGHIFNFTELLREAILLQIPPFIECNNGKCPERKTLSRYIKKEEKAAPHSKKDHVHYPFADL